MNKHNLQYRQCFLERTTPTGVESTTSWIPDVNDYTVPGSVLKLRSQDDIWTDGWVVRSSGLPLPASVVEANSRNYLKQRKASDVIFSEIQRENREASH